MDKFDRIYALDKIFKSNRYPVARQRLEQKLECSTKTIERTISDMRTFLNAPIEYNRDAGGYHYATSAQGPYELPGLWFDAGELAALCILDQQLGHIEPGLLAQELAPVRQRVNRLIENEGLGLAHLRDRVRILDQAARQPGKAFQTCAEALLRESRLEFSYHARSHNRTNHRTVSPQRLTHYRDNWYLDAWCHTANALRSFAVDRIQSAQRLATAAKTIDAKTLNNELAAAYGIFAGPVENTAVLIFSAERARWVADETWHSDQRSRYLPDGSYQLEIPYGDDRELIGDILRHGPHVTVKAPDALRSKIKHAISATAALYK